MTLVALKQLFLTFVAQSVQNSWESCTAGPQGETSSMEVGQCSSLCQFGGFKDEKIVLVQGWSCAAAFKKFPDMSFYFHIRARENLKLRPIKNI